MPPPNATVAAAWKALLDMLDVAGLCEEDVVGTPGSPPPFSEQEFLELIGGISEGGGDGGGTSFTPVQRALILAEWRKRTGTSASRSGNVSASPSNVGAANNINNKVAAGTPTSAAGGRGTNNAASPSRSLPRHNNSSDMSPRQQQVTMTNPQQLHPYSHVGNSAIAQQLCALLEEGNSAPALHAASELLERDAAELIQVLHTFLPHIPTVQLQDILGVRMGDAGGSHVGSFQNQNSMASLSGISHVPNSSSPRNTHSSPIGAMEARMAAHGMMPTSSPSGGNLSSRHTVNQSGTLRDDSIARMEYNEALRRYEQERAGGGGGDYSAGGSSTLRDTSQKIVDIPPSINGVIAPEGMLLTTQALSSQYGHGCLATVNGGRILHLPHVLQPGDCITVLRAQELVAVERERERNYRKH